MLQRVREEDMCCPLGRNVYLQSWEEISLSPPAITLGKVVGSGEWDQSLRLTTDGKLLSSRCNSGIRYFLPPWEAITASGCVFPGDILVQGDCNVKQESEEVPSNNTKIPLPVLVVLGDGGHLELTVEASPTSTVHDVKEAIFISMMAQRKPIMGGEDMNCWLLMYKHQGLHISEDDFSMHRHISKFLSREVITPVLEMRLRTRVPALPGLVGTIQLFVRNLSGFTLTVDVHRDATILELKEAVESQDGTPPDRQRLIFAGLLVEDRRTLSDYDITQESTLHMLVRLRGGMMHKTSGVEDYEELPAPTAIKFRISMPPGLCHTSSQAALQEPCTTAAVAEESSSSQPKPKRHKGCQQEANQSAPPTSIPPPQHRKPQAERRFMTVTVRGNDASAADLLAVVQGRVRPDMVSIILEDAESWELWALNSAVPQLRVGRDVVRRGEA